MQKAPDGHINAGRVDHSPRLMRIVEVLKDAEYPLSAQEIAIRAYDFARSGKVMLNISTNIGEIRAAANREAGYSVSFSTSWRQAAQGQKRGMRENADGSISFFLAQKTEHWHDGRPRYWLISAPGWIPTWKISTEGEIARLDCAEAKSERQKAAQPAPDRLCKNPTCRKPLPDDAWHTCDQRCNQDWKNSLTTPREQGAGQQGLF